jgi:hypothetical protein
MYYSGIRGDGDYYNVSCDDCKHNKSSKSCISMSKHDYILPSGDKVIVCDNFFPIDSCSFCSDGYCAYRWDYPC